MRLRTMSENPNPRTREDYLRDFVESGNPSDRQKEALKSALDIRKFEIDLYWKRAAYFWTFIAASFAGYFAFQKESGSYIGSMCLITCLGFLFSVAWYFVNRGSKAWQRNWELHVDLLEDEVTGPIYKTLLNRYSPRFWKLTDAYPFSPSKINQLVGVFVILVWLALMAHTVTVAWWSGRLQFWECIAITGLTLIASMVLFLAGRTQETGTALPVYSSKREYR